MRTCVLVLPGNEALGGAIARAIGAATAGVRVHEFPDGESRLTIEGDVAGAHVVACCTLDRPESRLARLLLVARGIRDQGARGVGLVAPYLPYMRQDDAFHPGEIVSARQIGRVLSDAFDWIVTVDPHLHRIGSLAEVFTVPAVAVSAAEPLAAWVREHVAVPVIVGPDEESRQWAGRVASLAGCEHLVLRKERHGDRDVRLAAPSGVHALVGDPVIVDDIVSTGQTLARASELLIALGAPAPTCVVVHAILAPGTEAILRAAGIARLVTTDTVPHPTNRIGVVPELASAVRSCLRDLPPPP